MHIGVFCEYVDKHPTTMIFTPSFKRKRRSNIKWTLKPFPYDNFNKKYEGIFTGVSVEVCANEDISAIYDNGFYGKGSQSRSTPHIVHHNEIFSTTPKNQVCETLSLSLEEAFFLAYYLKVLKIYDLLGNEIEYVNFFQNCLRVNELFLETLASYLYLKSKGWVVKSGLKFGGNYLIYRKGPDFYHASFVVIISTPTDTEFMDSKNVKGLQRIAETSDKDVLILEVHTPPDFHFLNIEAISNIEISEMLIRRFNFSLYVQNQNIK